MIKKFIYLLILLKNNVYADNEDTTVSFQTDFPHSTDPYLCNAGVMNSSNSPLDILRYKNLDGVEEFRSASSKVINEHKVYKSSRFSNTPLSFLEFSLATEYYGSTYFLDVCIPPIGYINDISTLEYTSAITTGVLNPAESYLGLARPVVR